MSMLHDSQVVVESFKNILDKINASFIAFDFESFYPSISPKLFHKGINFVKTIRDIPDKDIAIIMQSRRTLLFNNKEPWLKKTLIMKGLMPQWDALMVLKFAS